MPGGAAIKSIQSPSHPISVRVGTDSESPPAPSLRKGSVTLCQGSVNLDRDFVVEVATTQGLKPVALIETHPTLPNQRALMATIVPKFKLPTEKPEIIFVCDRSGSMGGTKIHNLNAALNIFLKSLPVGTKFNICSFGRSHSFLWEKAQTYGEDTLEKAVDHVKSFEANMGGTRVYEPVEAAFDRRYKDMNLEVFLLTDGEIGDQQQLFTLINERVTRSGNAIRVFTLGIGSGASTALVEGVARAGNGFAQMVQDSERMSKKVVRMLKAALLPHIHDYSLKIKYKENEAQNHEHEDFVMIENVSDSFSDLVFVEDEPRSDSNEVEQSTSLFDPSFGDGEDGPVVDNPNNISTTYGHLPSIPVPRYLQTPSVIPQLYPFSRTAVYIILSDSIPHRQPESVILKGTSPSGPLELEIPIVKLDKESSTIHQLASRKEIRELEDGRGWLTTAKNDKGALLKNEFEGRFSDMMEREAVRLGLRFQVGGKWCSFVGAEETTDAPVNQSKRNIEELRNFNTRPQAAARSMPLTLNLRNPPSAHPTSSQYLPDSSSRPGSSLAAAEEKKVMTTENKALFGPAKSTQDQSAAETTTETSEAMGAAVSTLTERPAKVLYSADFLLKFRNVPSAKPPPEFNPKLIENMTSKPDTCDSARPRSGRLGRTIPPGTSSEQRFSSSGSRPSGVGFPMGAFGAPPGQILPPGASSEKRFGLSYPAGSSTIGPPVNPLVHRLGFCHHTGSVSGPMGARCRCPPRPSNDALSLITPLDSASSAIDLSDKLQAIVALQTFIGNWAWGASLERILGVTSAAASLLELPGAVAHSARKEDVLATCCAVNFIKMELKEEEESWEMLVEKAESWLKDQIGDLVEELVKTLSSFLKERRGVLVGDSVANEAAEPSAA